MIQELDVTPQSPDRVTAPRAQIAKPDDDQKSPPKTVKQKSSKIF